MHSTDRLPSRPSCALPFATRQVALAFTALALAACSGGEPSTADSAHATGSGPVASPAMTAPHGGMLVELGNRVAYVEFVLDSTRGILTAHVLDATARQPLRLTQGRLDLTMFDLVEGNPEVVTVLAGKANPRTEETYDNTSVFIGFVPQLTGRSRFRASLQRVEIAGQVFTDVPVSYPSPART